jgi:hypothetical protein
MASSTKLGVWRRTGVRVQRTGRRTHRAHSVKSFVLNRCRAARAGISGRGRENLQTRDAASNVKGKENAQKHRPRTAPRGTKLPPSSAPPLPAALHARPAALRRAHRRCSATGAAVCPAPGQEPHHHRCDPAAADVVRIPYRDRARSACSRMHSDTRPETSQGGCQNQYP